MIKDCIKMFIVAFCADARKKVKITPDRDVYDTAQFISLLSGRCEVSEYQCAAFIKPLKKRPADSCAIMVPHADRDLFMLIAGIAAQLDIAVRFDAVEGNVSDEDLSHISYITQEQLRYGRKDGSVYLASMMYNENPLFEQCREPVFSAGLCVGAALARSATLLCIPEDNMDELMNFTLDTLIENGVNVERDPKTGEPIIRSMLSVRLPEKKPARKKTAVTDA